LREVRDAVGADFELMLDANCRLSEEEALEVGSGLDELNFAWFEEPIARADLDGYVRLNNAIRTPVTGGESWTTLEQFHPFLEAGAYSVAQLDVGTAGMTESWRIVEAATRFGVRVCPHNWHNGLLTMMQAHLVAALSDPHVLELCQLQGPLQWGLLLEPPTIHDGYLDLPDAPGYGVELAQDLSDKYPDIEGDYRIMVAR
jgi:L-alanine-DL-glutamate epimerase-like enolase superfamily enzyme